MLPRCRAVADRRCRETGVRRVGGAVGYGAIAIVWREPAWCAKYKQAIRIKRRRIAREGWAVYEGIPDGEMAKERERERSSLTLSPWRF